MKKTIFTFLMLTVVGLTAAVSQNYNTWTVETVPNTKLNDSRIYVSDPDNLIDDASEQEINSILGQAEAQSSAEVFVVALGSVGDVYIKDFATSLFNKWGIGKKSKDNGLLILMVEDVGKISFETGYGMEGVFPDAICMRIINNDMIPIMKTGNLGQGMLSGVKAVKKIIDDPKVSQEIMADMQKEQEMAKQDETKNLLMVLYAYLAISLLILFVSSRSAGKSSKQADPYEAYRKMSSAKPGYLILTVIFPVTMIFFIIWYNAKMRSLRRKPRLCPTCSKPMKLMKESQEDAYLSAGQQSEEIVGSVDYDVWVCMDCSERSIVSYGKEFTKYKTCPNCGYKTYAMSSDRILLAPTPISQGEGERVYRCSNCDHIVRKSYIIPMIILAAAGGRRGGGFGGGGFGGGGFGGGFGGGMSGGGGATGGWK